MKTLSFLGETPTIALRKAQEACGEDAIVIYTKKISTKSKNNTDMYEILIGLEEPNEDAIKTQTVRITNEQNKSLEAQFIDFKAEILKMQSSIEQVQKTIWAPKSQLFDLTIPLEFVDMYNLFEANEFDKEMIYTILKKTIEQLPVAFRSNPTKVNDFFKLVLKRLIPIKHEVPLQINQRKIMMFVGPTGVGKTTTIAKLAARYAYKLSQRHKVGIITLDTYRIGAVEQLMTYAKMMRLPIETVVDPSDFGDALNSLRHNDYILIDTVGSSQHDKEKIEKLKSFLKVDTFAEININLVLSAVTKYEDLVDIYKNFSLLPIDTFVFTKLDETKTYGNIFSLLLDTKKPVSYFSIGQEVPDDLMEAEADYLLKGILNKEFN